MVLSPLVAADTDVFRAQDSRSLRSMCAVSGILYRFDDALNYHQTRPAETKSWISISAMNGTLTYTLMGLKSKSASSLSTLLP